MRLWKGEWVRAWWSHEVVECGYIGASRREFRALWNWEAASEQTNFNSWFGNSCISGLDSRHCDEEWSNIPYSSFLDCVFAYYFALLSILFPHPVVLGCNLLVVNWKTLEKLSNWCWARKRERSRTIFFVTLIVGFGVLYLCCNRLPRAFGRTCPEWERGTPVRACDSDPAVTAKVARSSAYGVYLTLFLHQSAFLIPFLCSFRTSF